MDLTTPSVPEKSWRSYYRVTAQRLIADMKQRFAMKTNIAERYSTGGEGSRRKIDSAVTFCLNLTHPPAPAFRQPQSVVNIIDYCTYGLLMAKTHRQISIANRVCVMLHRLIRIKCVATASPIKISKDNNIATDKKAVSQATGPEGYFSLVTAVHRVR